MRIEISQEEAEGLLKWDYCYDFVMREAQGCLAADGKKPDKGRGEIQWRERPE